MIMNLYSLIIKINANIFYYIAYYIYLIIFDLIIFFMRLRAKYLILKLYNLCEKSLF